MFFFFNDTATTENYPPSLHHARPNYETSEHNILFLGGVKNALTADAAWDNGWYDEQPTKGLRAMARVYAGWGFSQAFYWDEMYREMDYSSLEDFLIDRKSTRLNSSHANISYAVFCLKKKKTKVEN